ncbi:MAG: DUF3467 domain-containing protein [Candidatus Odinarchaeota archaeon]
MTEKSKPKINLSRDPEKVNSYYSIGALGGYTPWDFRISFYNDFPALDGRVNEFDRKILTEVILSPLAAKELCAWLLKNIENYEKQFGPIRKGKPADDKPSADDWRQDWK